MKMRQRYFIGERVGYDPSRRASSRRPRTWRCLGTHALVAMFVALGYGSAYGSDTDDRRVIAALDTTYQRAVKDNDAKTMAAILADDFVLVEGDGKRSTKADLLRSATDGHTHYQHQEDSDQTIVLYGDTAVLTAKLWAQGIEDGTRVDYTLWFSDVYVRTASGWKYVFGQASLALPKQPKHAR